MPKTIPSRAAVLGHPIHPVLVPFPITLVTAALFADVVYAVNDGEAWASAWATGSAWLLWGAVATGVLAAVTGAVDYLGSREVRRLRTATLHGVGNAVVLVVTLANALIRLGDPQDAVLPWGLVLSAVAALGLVFTGWLGGELSYRHLVGADPHRGTSRTGDTADAPGPPLD